jgi:Polyketide cyclase / dehydrase and lipid transport
MAVDVRTSIEIARPRRQVAEYVANPDNAMSWYTNINEVQWESSPPVEVGTKVAFVATLLGRTLRYTYEVQLVIPDERVVMGTAEGPFPMETSYAWRDTPSGGTLMELRHRGELKGLSKLSAPMMKSAMRRANAKDLKRLRHILESGHP